MILHDSLQCLLSLTEGKTASFSGPDGPHLLSNFYCTGSESSLIECSHSSCFSIADCIHRYYDAGVICERMISICT